MKLLTTISTSAVLAAGAVMLIGNSPGEFVPLPRPRPAMAEPVVERHEPPELYGAEIPPPTRVRSIPITKEEHQWRPPPSKPETPAGPVASLPPPKRHVTVARTVHDVCARVGRKKVYTSKYSWRCRR
jgi:hypothetical protein